MFTMLGRTINNAEFAAVIVVFIIVGCIAPAILGYKLAKYHNERGKLDRN